MLFHTELLYLLKITDKNKIMILTGFKNHPNKKPVLCYDKNGLLIRKFESIRDGSKFYKISEHAICNNLIGRSKSCNNLIWKYA